MNQYFLFLVTIFLGIQLIDALGQTQVGDDLFGIAEGEEFGYSVSISDDGSRIAVGAPFFFDVSDNKLKGRVRVLDLVDGSWIQAGNTILGSNDFDFLGFSVALSSDGNTLAIGAVGPTNADITGTVRVYTFVNNGWTQQGEDIDGAAIGDEFGTSVDISSDGNRIAIGAPRNGGNGVDSGNVQVFEFENGVWTQLGDDLTGAAPGDRSGTSVSISADGQRVAVGAPNNGEDAGHVRVFEWTNGSWSILGIPIEGEGTLDQSGTAVSLSEDGNRVAIGAFLNDGEEPGSGHVRIYEWNGNNWAQLGDDIDGETTADNFGQTVSLTNDGNYVAIGAPRFGVGDEETGYVQVYKWTDDSWEKFGDDIIGKEPMEFFGSAVAFSADGQRVICGGRLNDVNGTRAGRVEVNEFTVLTTKNKDQRISLELYPNPTHRSLFFNQIVEEVELISQTGQVIKRLQTHRRHQIDVSNLPNGIYFVKCYIGEYQIIRKFVKH